jgi:DNA repair protein RadC
MADMSGAVPHYLGHRERLRQRLFEAGAENLPDYEILEMRVPPAIPAATPSPWPRR